MLDCIISAIVAVLMTIYLIRKHTWYQVALLGIIIIAIVLAEAFTNWSFDFWSCIIGGFTLLALNLEVTID